jgi:hypothetical protein
MTRVAEVSHADELPQLNQLRCRRTEARKKTPSSNVIGARAVAREDVHQLSVQIQRFDLFGFGPKK